MAYQRRANVIVYGGGQSRASIPSLTRRGICISAYTSRTAPPISLVVITRQSRIVTRSRIAFRWRVCTRGTRSQLESQTNPGDWDKGDAMTSAKVRKKFERSARDEPSSPPLSFRPRFHSTFGASIRRFLLRSSNQPRSESQFCATLRLSIYDDATYAAPVFNKSTRVRSVPRRVATVVKPTRMRVKQAPYYRLQLQVGLLYSISILLELGCSPHGKRIVKYFIHRNVRWKYIYALMHTHTCINICILL